MRPGALAFVTAASGLLVILAGCRPPMLPQSPVQSSMHRRFALPAATLIFGLLVVPLFLSRAHFSRAGGGLMGVVVIVVYYGLQRLWPGTEPWALLLPAALIASGAWQFTLLRRSRETASEAA